MPQNLRDLLAPLHRQTLSPPVTRCGSPGRYLAASAGRHQGGKWPLSQHSPHGTTRLGLVNCFGSQQGLGCPGAAHWALARDRSATSVITSVHL
jgi:hypothetical protein